MIPESTLRERGMLFLLIVSLFLVFVLPWGVSFAEQRALSPLEAQQMLAENKGNEKFFVIDLRTKEEFEEGRIAGARLIPFYATNFLRMVSQLDREATLFLYCQRGRQSPLALKALESQRFSNIFILDGGITAWVKADLPVVR